MGNTQAFWKNPVWQFPLKMILALTDPEILCLKIYISECKYVLKSIYLNVHSISIPMSQKGKKITGDTLQQVRG